MRSYKPATFQPTVRPDWGGVLSYIPVEEKAKILEAIIKYPSVDIDSVFWQETIKPDLDLQYETFTQQCEMKSRAMRDRWGKTSCTSLQDNNKTSNKDVIVPEGIRIEEEIGIKENRKIIQLENQDEKYLEKFEEFWKAYTPIKCDGRFIDKGSKKTAQEKFIKILKKGEKYEDIISGCKKYIEHCRRNNQLTCGVTVFLNQERWKNDYSGETCQSADNTKRQEPRSYLEIYSEIANELSQEDNIR